MKAFFALNHFEGKYGKVKSFYTDNAPELIDAGKKLGWAPGRNTSSFGLDGRHPTLPTYPSASPRIY